MKTQQVIIIGLITLIAGAGIAAVFFLKIKPSLDAFEEPAVVEVDMPVTSTPPAPTFIIYLDEKGKPSYEIEGKQVAKEISFNQLRNLLEKHQIEEKNAAVEIRPVPLMDYKILRESLDEITKVHIKNLRIADTE